MRLFASLPAYQRPWLRGDLIAGLTLWAILVPQALAYASIANVSPVVGLYAASRRHGQDARQRPGTGQARNPGLFGPIPEFGDVVNITDSGSGDAAPPRRPCRSMRAPMTSYAFPNSWEAAQRRLELLQQCHDPSSIRCAKALGMAPGWCCLDAGAGGGSFARRLAGTGADVLAVDLDVGVDPTRARTLPERLDDPAGWYPGPAKIIAWGRR